MLSHRLETIQSILLPIEFGLLFSLMLLYWVQVAFFSYTKYKQLNIFVFYTSFFALTSILGLRWIESGHFPLSNLYESLLFLSWSFLLSQLVFQSNWHDTTQKTKVNAAHHSLQDKTDLSYKAISAAPIDSPDRDQTRKEEFATDLNLHLSGVNNNDILTTSGATLPMRAPQSLATGLIGNLRNEKRKVPISSSNRYSLQDLLGVVISPLALVCYGFAFLNLPKEMQKATALVPALQSNWLMMHVTVMILSYAALLCGSILSMAFLLIHFLSVNSITNKVVNINEDSTYSELCDLFDNLSYRFLGLGFPLLTIGILSGAVWANQAWGAYWSWDPKETWALITWFVFAVYLHARITKGLKGKNAALIASAGFFVVWFCYLGVNLIGSGLHSYGWFK